MEMMSLNELHYLIGAMGFGLFLTSGISTLMNHGWRFPYKWYVTILFYCGFTFAVNTPIVDSYCAASAQLDLLRDIANMGLAPVTMLAVCKFARLSNLTALITQVLAWTGGLGLILGLHHMVSPMVGWLFFGIYTATTVVWCIVACRSFLDGSDSSYLEVDDKRWFAYFTVIVALLSVVPQAVRLALPFLHVERLILVADSAFFFPLLLFFQYNHGHLVYPSEIHSAKS